MPTDSRYLFNYGQCLAERKNLELACEYVQKAISLNTSYGEVAMRLFLSKTLISLNRVQEAKQELKVILTNSPVWDYEEDDYQEAENMLKNMDNNF